MYPRLIQSSGSAKFEPKYQNPPLGMSKMGVGHLLKKTGPIESDGPSDTAEWNLYEKFLKVSDDCLEDLKKSSSLSEMLADWEWAVHISTTEDPSEEVKAKQAELGARTITRL